MVTAISVIVHIKLCSCYQSWIFHPSLETLHPSHWHLLPGSG